MTQLVLEHLDEAALASLSELAKLNRLSVAEQVERILAEAVDMRARRRRSVESAARIAAIARAGFSRVQVISLSDLDRPRR